MKLLQLLAGAALWMAAPAVQAQQTLQQPLVHDPVMAYEGGTYYLYCTGNGITQMTSADRRHWTVSQEGVLSEDKIPAWTHDSVPGFTKHIWAPDVIRYGGKWYLAYSCSTFGRNTSAIGLLSNTSLADANGWKDEGCLVASREGRDEWNAIDPNFIVDGEGQPWLTWGSFWDGIQLIPLDRQTLHVKEGATPRTIARRHAPGDTTAEPNPTSKYAGTNAIEAPFIMRHDGYYYLFVSWDYCCRGTKSNYRMAVGRSSRVEGPYLDRDGKDMRMGGGTLILEGDKKRYEAMGHGAAYHFPDGDRFFCHGYSLVHNGASILVERTIHWTPDGWPELRP